MNDDQLFAFCKLSATEKFLETTRMMKEDRIAHPEKYPYKKPGLYIGGVLWEEGDGIITGIDGLPHIIKKSPTL